MPRSSVITAIVKEVEEPAFSPIDVSGLQLWLDASDASTITESGGSVSQWDDKSGNGNHATQGAFANPPTTNTRTVNSLNVFDFSSGDYLDLDTGLFRNKSYGGIFIVAKADDTSTQGVLFYASISTNGSSARTWLTMNATANRVDARGRRLDSDSNVVITSDTDHGTNAHVFMAEYDWANATLSLYQSGVLVAQDTSFQTPGSTSDTESLGSSIGSLRADSPGTNNSFNFNGIVAEVLVYDSALSTTDREDVETYLANKWGITLS